MEKFVFVILFHSYIFIFAKNKKKSID